MGDEVPVAPLSQKVVPVAPLSQKEVPLGPLSPWLRLMLAEIARKRDEHERGRAEAARRASETDPTAARGEPSGTENPPLP